MAKKLLIHGKFPYLNQSQEVTMKAMEMRGAAFRRRRMARGLSTDKVAKILKLPRHNVVAYEAGIIMQLPQDAEERFSSLNSKWTAEDLRNHNLKKAG